LLKIILTFTKHQLNINKNIIMETLLERATALGLKVSSEPIVLPELVKELNRLALEHNICAAGFRGWLIGNDIPFTEEFEFIDEDGDIHEDGHFILDEFPQYGFNFEDCNDGHYFALEVFEI
jgi:hypothetical protein